MGAYGNAQASSDNVDYPFGSYQAAAQAAHRAATNLTELGSGLGHQSTEASISWTGPLGDVFAEKARVFQQSCTNLSSACDGLASGIAGAWSAARGQQDRINFARYVQHETDDDNIFENAFEYFAGEDDYGPPPSDPPRPGSGDGYAPTRRPMYPQFGP